MSRKLKRVPFNFKWPLNKVYFRISEKTGKKIGFGSPPKGNGYQLWEDCSEGSPISPIFKTLDELCAWAESNATTFANYKATKEQWREMLDKDFVHHRVGNIIFI